MKRVFYILIIISFSRQVLGQTNLVPNSSFEQYVLCPDASTDISYATGWYSSANTPDYFNVCSTNSNYLVPKNGWAYQWPYAGNAYAGFWTYYPFAPNGREFITRPIISPLTIGTKYYLTYKVSLANISMCAIKKIGCFFSTNNYTIPSNTLGVNNNPQCYSNSILSDTLNWMVIQDSLTSDSSYNYISFGNFHDDTFTIADTIMVGPYNSLGGAYYLIDDICLSTSKTLCNIILDINSINADTRFLIMPNPFSEKFNIQNSNASAIRIKIFDSIGSLVSDTFSNEELAEVEINNSSGIYNISIYDAQTNKLLINKKILKQ